MMKNKNMKHILILITLVVFLGCDEDAPTDKSDDQIQTEYTLEELENDPDWQLVTDIQEIGNPCLKSEFVEGGVLLRTRNELDQLFTESGEIDSISRKYCHIADELEVDFENSSIIFHYLDWVERHSKRYIFKNDKLKKYIYLNILYYNLSSRTEPLVAEFVTIPKVSDDYTFNFDTIQVDGLTLY